MQQRLVVLEVLLSERHHLPPPHQEGEDDENKGPQEGELHVAQHPGGGHHPGDKHVEDDLLVLPLRLGLFLLFQLGALGVGRRVVVVRLLAPTSTAAGVRLRHGCPRITGKYNKMDQSYFSFRVVKFYPKLGSRRTTKIKDLVVLAVFEIKHILCAYNGCRGTQETCTRRFYCVPKPMNASV